MSRKRKLTPDSENICESWSKTEQYKVRGRHMWTIDDFMRRAGSTEVGDSLCSPVFSVTVEGTDGEAQNLTFQLEVFPNGEEGEDNSDYVAVFLTSRRQEDLDVKYDFSGESAPFLVGKPLQQATTFLHSPQDGRHLLEQDRQHLQEVLARAELLVSFRFVGETIPMLNKKIPRISGVTERPLARPS